jgi:hypothetical protein
MSKLFAPLILLGLLAGILRAQPSHATVFFAPGGVTCCGHTAMTLQAGIGGEAVLFKGIGLGADIGAIGPKDSLIDSMGVFSANGYYHFSHRKAIKSDPYVTGGYTLMFRGGHFSLYNFGAGINYWFIRRLGFQVEFRDQLHSSFGTVHYWGARLGLVIR